MNRIVYQGMYEFSDKAGTLMQGATAYRTFSPLGNELQAEQYKIPIIYKPRLFSRDIETFMSGAARNQRVNLFQDQEQVGFFYLSAITGGQKLGEGRYLCYLEGVDLAGFYVGRTHRGGVYSGETFGNVLQSILGGNMLAAHNESLYELIDLSFQVPSVYVDADLYTSTVSGWLPYTNDARENLRTLLQLKGARLTWLTGPDQLFGGAVNPYITTKFDGLPADVSAYKTYVGDEFGEDEKVKECIVIEHDYRAASGDVETLYETTGSVSNYLVVFNDPYHSLDVTDTLTINSSGANYAIVSGQGTLTGVPYVDYSRQLSGSIAGNAGGVTKYVDNTLVDSLHSADMMLRMQNYYSNAKTIKNAMVISDTVMPGSVLRIEDPSGEDVDAYITEQTVEFSGITKSTGELIAGWSPISGNVFSKATVMTEAGTFAPDEGCTLLRMILIQGGQGGWGGYKGESATSPGFGQPASEAGEGGDPGEGGSPGNVLRVDLEQSDIAASYTVTVGAAGQAGAKNHGEGSYGTDSTVTDGNTTWSSAYGAASSGGFYDPLTGKVYASKGQDGIYAGKPGSGSNYGAQTLADYATGVTGNTVWRSGSSSSVAGGGGPAYGSNGNNASRFNGAAGANAVLDGFNGYTAPIGTFGSGGIGGNGGGGGGGTTNIQASGGSGGDGSVGGDGAPGAVLFLQAFGTQPAPAPTKEWLLDADGEQLYDSYFERLRAQEE